MNFRNAYLAEVYENVCKRNAGEPEFLQAVGEELEKQLANVLISLSAILLIFRAPTSLFWRRR